MPHLLKSVPMRASIFPIVLISSWANVANGQSAPPRRLRSLGLAQLAESSTQAHSTADGSAQTELDAGARRVKLHMGRAESEHEVQASATHKVQSATKSDLPKPSGWFGSFSEGESTFSEDGVLSSPDDPEFFVQNGGKDPAVGYPFFTQSVRESEFFHESESAGPLDAWQTHFPPVDGSVAGNRNIRNGAWMYTPNGWVQDYVTQNDDPRTYSGSQPTQPVNMKDPSWFDNRVQQYDGFGRYKLPKMDSGFYLSERGWKERSVNTTLKCKDPGCIANVSISLFDTSTEVARNCRLSVNVHPTDFDDDWSREIVKYLKVNGAVAARNCNPRARGCNGTAERPLFPCLNGFNVDHLVDGNGTLVVEGKISHWVDECPVEENLLNGVVMVTCMVVDEASLLAGEGAEGFGNRNGNSNGNGDENGDGDKDGNGDGSGSDKDGGDSDASDSGAGGNGQNGSLQVLTTRAGLRCDYPGCEAKTLLQFSPAYALNGGKCLLSVNVTQTDFDDDLGLPEDVEYIAVAGKNATDKPVSPGKNPCTAEYKGQPLKDDEKIYNVLKDYDVTDAIKETYPLGTLLVTGKISTQVDECGSNGFLLDGKIAMVCTPAAEKSTEKLL